MEFKTSLLRLAAISLLLTTSTAAHSFATFSTAWNPGANTARFGGSPAPGGATWSIIGAGVSSSVFFDSHAGTSTSVASLNNALDIPNIINDAFNSWADVSNFTNLGQVADSGVGFGSNESGIFGDIRIGATSFDGPSGILAHAYQPGTDAQFNNGSIAGDIHIDNSENWVSGFDLATVLLHEIGHTLGLAHSADRTSVMFASYLGVRTALAQDDILGIQSIYGASIIAPPPAVVPLPAAPMLFLSAIGLVGLINRKKISIKS